MRESDLDVNTWRVVDLDNMGLQVVDLDVFWKSRGCVVSLDVGMKKCFYDSDKPNLKLCLW